MLNLIGATVGMMAVTVNLVAMAGALPLSAWQRVVFAAGTGAWVGLAIGLGAAGALVFSPEQKVPLIGVLFAVPLLIGAVLWFTVPRFCAALMAVPMPLLIGLNAMRIFGALFLILAAVGRLSGPFPYSAGWGDVITGLLAIPLALVVAREPSPPGWIIAAWNLFGTLDLFAAVALGLTSAQGSPLQANPCRRRLGGDAASSLQPGADCPGVVLSRHARGDRRAARSGPPVGARRLSGRRREPQILQTVVLWHSTAVHGQSWRHRLARHRLGRHGLPGGWHDAGHRHGPDRQWPAAGLVAAAAGGSSVRHSRLAARPQARGAALASWEFAGNPGLASSTSLAIAYLIGPTRPLLPCRWEQANGRIRHS
jgi:hypothetical protein